MSRRGVSLAELLISVGLLLLLTTMLFAALASGARGWMAGSRSADLSADLLVVSRQMERQLQSSTALSVDLTQASAVAFASAFGLSTGPDRDRFCTAGSVSPAPVWQKYLLYWYDAGSRQIFRREVAIPAGNPAASTPTPLSAFDGGSGPHPVSFYTNSGVAIGHNIYEFDLAQVNGCLLVGLYASGTDNRAGDTMQQLITSTWLRN